MEVALRGVTSRDWKGFEVHVRNRDIKENSAESSERSRAREKASVFLENP